jgi:hypothetical protein
MEKSSELWSPLTEGDLAIVLEYRITVGCLLPDNSKIKRVFKSSHGLARACQLGDSGLTKGKSFRSSPFIQTQRP